MRIPSTMTLPNPSLSVSQTFAAAPEINPCVGVRSYVTVIKLSTGQLTTQFNTKIRETTAKLTWSIEVRADSQNLWWVRNVRDILSACEEAEGLSYHHSSRRGTGTSRGSRTGSAPFDACVMAKDVTRAISPFRSRDSVVGRRASKWASLDLSNGLSQAFSAS